MQKLLKYWSANKQLVSEFTQPISIFHTNTFKWHWIKLDHYKIISKWKCFIWLFDMFLCNKAELYKSKWNCHSQLKDIVNFFNGSSGRKPDSPFTTPSTAFSHILAKQRFPTLLVKCIKFCMVDFHQNFSIESRIFRFFNNHKNCRD